MIHNPPAHNCHGVALDVFMTMVVRHRWEEVRDMWPDDYQKPTVDPFRIDDSWIGARSFENMTPRDEINRSQSFRNWRKRPDKPKHFTDSIDPELENPLPELNTLGTPERKPIKVEPEETHWRYYDPNNPE